MDIPEFDGLLGCFQFGVIRNNATVTPLCKSLGVHALISIACIHRSGIAESIDYV